MKKLPVFVFIILLTCIAFGFTSFFRLAYDEVVAYEIDKEQDPYQTLFDDKGNINTTKKGVKLTASQIKRLIQIMNDTLTYGARHSYSHYSTIGFVFNRKGKRVNWIEVGLMSNTIKPTGNFKALRKYYDLWDPVDIGDKPIVYDLTGLSPIGRKNFREFIKELNIKDTGGYLSHWDSTEVEYSKLKRRF